MQPLDLETRMKALRDKRKLEAGDGWERHAFKLPEGRTEALKLIRQYPKATYSTHVERSTELPSGEVECVITLRQTPRVNV